MSDVGFELGIRFWYIVICHSPISRFLKFEGEGINMSCSSKSTINIAEVIYDISATGAKNELKLIIMCRKTC